MLVAASERPVLGQHEPAGPARLTEMDWSTYLMHLESDGRLLEAAAHSGLDADVPCCPGWLVRDVVEHTGIVHRHKTSIVRGRLLENPDPVDAPTSDVVSWYRSGLDELLETLRAANPTEHVFTWYPPDQSVGFWYRRMAHETLIHRVDAEQGLGAVSPIDAELAADGIDEVLTVYVGGYPPWGAFDPSADVARIECVDRPEAWNVRFGRFSGTSPVTGTSYDLDSFITIAAELAPTAVIRGSAADLDLWLWGRAALDRTGLSGDDSLAVRLRSICEEGMG